MAEKDEHLKMLQTVISRMAQNSFALKGWAVTLVTALLTLSVQGKNLALSWVAYLPLLMFALLDAYYLWQERLFRELFEVTRKAASVDFSMDTKPLRSRVSWILAVFSTPVLGFYLILLGAVLFVQIILAFRA